MDFDKEVQAFFKDYLGDVMTATSTVVPEVAKETANRIKSTAPKRTGKYAKSWKMSTEKGRTNVKTTIYADKPEYRLTHLLEYGHAKRGGGRVQGQEHIEPAEKWAAEEVVSRLRRAMT